MTRVTGFVVAALLTAVAAAAQPPASPLRGAQRGGVEPPVQLRFQDGRVTLRAQNAPIRAILLEWARLGGTTIVNGDQLPGPPLTLELTGVPERQALDIVLRSAAGYLLAPRRAGATGVSAFDRIVILPTSVAPRNPPPPAAAARPAIVRPPVIARPIVPPVPDAALVDTAPDVEPPDDVTQAADPVAAPGPPQPRVLPRPLVRPPVVAPGVAGGAPELVPEQAEPDAADTDGAPATASTPGNPFGIPAGSSTQPGVIAPAPKPQPQQPQPANRVQ